MDSVYTELKVSKKKFEKYFDQYAPPPNSAESLSATKLCRAVFPIFRENAAEEKEHEGSGVLLEIGDELFVLSAAHVFDHAEGSPLYMPAADQLDQMHGSISQGVMPECGSRKDDRVDMAYYRLATEWKHKLHPDITPASIFDLLLTDVVETGNVHTFCGYPWRKTKRRGTTFMGEQITYTGHLQPSDVYRKFGYSRKSHIVIRFRRNKAHSNVHGPNSPAVRPEGVSGGAVFSWPTTFKERVSSPTLKIAAIAHSYHERDHCLASTRVISAMMAIVRNNPHLASHFLYLDDMADELRLFLHEIITAQNKPFMPPIVGIAWYTESTYRRCLDIFDDASGFPDTFAEWLKLAESTENQLAIDGVESIRAEIDPETFPDWCSIRGIDKLDSDARMAFGNEKAFESIQHLK